MQRSWRVCEQLNWARRVCEQHWRARRVREQHWRARRVRIYFTHALKARQLYGRQLLFCLGSYGGPVRALPCWLFLRWRLRAQCPLPRQLFLCLGGQPHM